MTSWTLTATHQPLTPEQRPEPTPGPGEVVVHLHAAALNRRDYFITQGLYPGIRTPVVPGSDGAGTLAAAGPDVDTSDLPGEVLINPGLDWGDRNEAQGTAFHILGMPRDGTFATEVVVPASQIHPKPEHLDWTLAAALPLAGVTAHRAVFRQGGLQPGETVLITGIGGGVATFALQFAVAAGAKVWVTSSSPDKIHRAVALGALGGFDYRDPDWTRACQREAGAPDLIVDGAGGPGQAALVNVVRPGGRIVHYGATAGAPQRLDLFKVFWKQIRLVGSTMGSPADFSAMLDFVRHHRIRPVVDRTLPLESVNEALDLMESSPQFGKITLAIP